MMQTRHCYSVQSRRSTEASLSLTKRLQLHRVATANHARLLNSRRYDWLRMQRSARRAESFDLVQLLAELSGGNKMLPRIADHIRARRPTHPSVVAHSYGMVT